MAKEVIMPKAGMDMKEGVIVRWLVETGARVKEGDALLEIETDKVTMEVESPADGVLLRRYFSDGDTVPVVTVIGYVGEAGEATPDAPSPASADAPRAGGSGGAAPVPVPANAAATDAGPGKTAAAGRGAAGSDYDVAVVGGGPAGYVAAIRAAQLGGKVVLFERDAIGGTCLNRGCIPTKAYLKTAELVKHIRAAPERGVILGDVNPKVDLARVKAAKDKTVKRLTAGVDGLLQSWRVKIVRGTARLAEPGVVECGGARYRAGGVILCGGSRPGKLPIPGADGKRVLDSDALLALETLPASLAVVGGGVVGCELATAFAAFGSRVVVIEAMDRLAPMLDRDVSLALADGMERMGVRTLLSRKVEGIEETENAAAVRLAGNETVEAELVLLSIGRVPDLSCLGALSGGVALERGRIAVDDHCRASIPGLYACGDVTSSASLAHAAFEMGLAAAANAMGGNESADLRRIPACVYTLPEAAGVGLTEAEAKGRGQIRVGKFPFAANGRALASGEAEGFVKVVADKRFGEILGVHMVGPMATELIAEAKALMDAEVTLEEAARIMHAHPTYSEAFAEALGDALGTCVHLPKKETLTPR